MIGDELDQAVAELRSVAPLPNGTYGPGDVDEAEVRYHHLRSRLLTPDQLDTLPPPEPLIEGYCALNSFTTTFGRPGTAKTLIEMAKAFSVVTGQPWFGHRVRKGPVLYIVGEGTAGLAQRQRAWREVCGWPALDGLHWLPKALNLLDASREVSALVMLVEELAPVLVIVDTLARSMPGGDENSSTDMSAIVAASDRIREAAGCTVDLVHHTPREGSTPRGHSALEGAVDTALLLERTGNLITLSAHKQKDLPTLPPMVFELTPVGSSVVLTLPNSLPNGRGSEQDLVGAERALSDLVWQSAGSDGLPSGELQRMSELPERSYYRALKVLRERGIVRNIGTDRKPRFVPSDEAESEMLPTLPNAAMAATKTLTANNPPYRGLAALVSSDSEATLDLDDGEPPIDAGGVRDAH